MAEYIEREAAINAFENGDADVCEEYPDGYCDWGFGRENIADIISKIPAADVAPVVRCKDCAHAELFEGSECLYCTNFDGLLSDVADDDYCSYGERKEND